MSATRRKPKTQEPSADWRAMLSKRGWTAETNLPGDYQAGMKDLKTRLLAFGGWATCLPVIEEDLKNIMGRGLLMKGRGRTSLRLGQACRCHSNSAYLWNAEPHLKIMTGYALSKDGVWRQHSWCIDTGASTYSIIETTQRRVAYYGFIMTDAEAERFYEENE